MKKGLFYFVGVLWCFVFFTYTSLAHASETESLLRLLIKKGLITESEYEQIKEEMKNEEADSLSLSGSIYGEYRWTKNRDITDPDTDSTSNLYLRKIELAVEAELTEWATATAVLNSEWIGDEINAGDEHITVDEATITLQEDGFPFYLVFGKRTQPFGVYENHLVTDPMTQDAYETKRVGLTAGYAGPAGIDFSVTVYKGEQQMDHLFESGLFEDTVSRAAGESEDDVSAFIVSASLSPVEGVTVFGSYLSEPGRGTRNETVNGGISVAPVFWEGLRLDAEYMKALNREKYSGLNKEYKEGVLSVTAAYEFVVRKRKSLGGGLYAERKAHLITEPLEVALRYEHFDDNGMNDDLGVWTVKDRYSFGARYSFYNDEQSGLNLFVAAECRRTDYRANANMKDSNDEVYLRLGVDF